MNLHRKKKNYVYIFYLDHVPHSTAEGFSLSEISFLDPIDKLALFRVVFKSVHNLTPFILRIYEMHYQITTVATF